MSALGWQIFDTVAAIVAAYVLALPLALEREASAEARIGLRTMPLVSVGACAYVLISRLLYSEGVFETEGLSRTLRAVMTGIGFIGGGAIVKYTRDVRGLATGAAVWTSGAIGAAVAHGYYEIALVLGLANVIVLEIPHVLRRSRKRHQERS